jgi:anti-sigma-K factor RskA
MVLGPFARGLICPLAWSMFEGEDIDGLASEYVLGSLDKAERKEVNARRKTDASLTSAIEAWERRLGPLSEEVPGVEPPSHLLNSILARIPEQKRRTIRSTEVIPLRATARPWWPRAMGTAALVACLALAPGWLIHMQTRAPTTQVAGMDCSKLYKDFWAKFNRERLANIPAEQLAGVSRMALRAYDACQAGDESDANAMFNRLRRVQSLD